MTSPSPEPPPTTSREWLMRYVRDAASAMLLMELPHGTLIELSSSLIELTGLDPQALLGTQAADHTADPAAARRSLALLSDGTLLGYSRLVRLSDQHPGSTENEVRVDVCGDPASPDLLAVATFVPAGREEVSSTRDSALDRTLGLSTPLMGTLDREGVIDRVVSGGRESVAGPAERLLGVRLTDLVHPLDVGVVLLLLAHCDARQLSVTGRIRMLASSGEWRPAQVTLQTLVGVERRELGGYAFVVSAHSGGLGPRAVTAEGTEVVLERNASQYRAASATAWLSSWSRFPPRPEFRELTVRELEILARLQGGQRVKTIARDLFLSQSTVRNHLSGVFRKFGVRSQAELLDRLQGP